MMNANFFAHLKYIAAQLLEKAWELVKINSNCMGDEMQQIPVRTMTDIKKISSTISTLMLEIHALAQETLPKLEKDPVNAGKELIEVRHKLRMLISLIKGYSEIVIEDLQSTQDKFLIKEFHHIIDISKQTVILIDQLRDSNEDVIEDQSTLFDWSKIQEKPGNINTIMIVDDSEQNSNLLKNWLQRKGYEIVVAHSGKEALMQLNAHPEIDIVLLDVMMPVMDGFEILTIIKQEPKFSHTMVIMISGLDNVNSIARCIMGGAEDYLIRPINPYILYARIHACSEKKHLLSREKSHLDSFALILSMMNILKKE